MKTIPPWDLEMANGIKKWLDRFNGPPRALRQRTSKISTT
jgi:hypothetical protein